MAKIAKVDGVDYIIPNITYGQRRTIESAIHTIATKNKVIQNISDKLHNMLEADKVTDIDSVDNMLSAIEKYKQDIVTSAATAIAGVVKKADNTDITVSHVAENISLTGLVELLIMILDENTLSEDKKK